MRKILKREREIPKRLLAKFIKYLSAEIYKILELGEKVTQVHTFQTTKTNTKWM